VQDAAPPEDRRASPARAAREVGRTLETVWRTDAGMTALVVVLFCTLIVAPPLLGAGIVKPVVFDVLFSLILISAATAVATRRWASVTAVALAVASVAFRWINFGLGHPSIALVDAAIEAVAFLFFAALVMSQVLRRGSITMHRVRGAVAAYLLFGLAWSAAYQVVYDLAPGAFRLAAGNDPRLELLYFSFVTLTTVGYGDITPILPTARSLAIAEALIGQLFPAVLIGRLVGLEVSGRRGRGDDPSV